MELSRSQPRSLLSLRPRATWLLWLVGAFGYGAVFALSPLAGLLLLALGLIAWYGARRLEGMALLMFLLLPLGRLTWIDATGNLDAAKFYVLLLALAWGARCLLRKDAKLITVWTEDLVTVLILFLFLANFLSLLNTYSLGRSLLSLIRLTSLFVMYLLVVTLVRTKRDVKTALVFLLFSGLVACLIGFWEVNTQSYLWMKLGQERSLPLALATGFTGSQLPWTGEGGKTLRVMSVFTDYNFMGGYMAVLLGLTGGCFLAWRQWWVRLLLLGMAGIALASAVLTGSRGGLVAVAVTLLSLLALSRIRLRWFLLTGLLILAVAVLPVVNELAPQFRHGISAENLRKDQRYGYWQMALQMMSDHPLIGVGADNFTALYPFYRVSPALMYKFYCHNIYLQEWAEAGTIGFIVILSLVFSVGLSYYRARRATRDPTWEALVSGLLAAFLGYAVFAATCNCLHDQPFWWLMALSVVALRATRREELEGSEEAE